MDFKKLTAQEVASKRFTPVRMREGYSIDEVDEFLSSMEETITAYDSEKGELQRVAENLKNNPPVGAVSPEELADLKRRLETTLAELTDVKNRNSTLQGTVESMGQNLIEARNKAEAAEQAKEAAELATANAIEMAHNAQAVAEKPMDIAGASGAVARMLETAAKNYDDLVQQGEAEAKLTRDHANIEAAEVLSRAEKEAAATLAEANAAKQDAFASIESQKRGLEASVSHLKSVDVRARQELLRIYEAGIEEVKSMPQVVENSEVIAPRIADPAPTASGAVAYGDVPSFNN